MRTFEEYMWMFKLDNYPKGESKKSKFSIKGFPA